MPVYKVYIVNNYIFIQDTVTDEIISGHAKSVRVVPQLKVGGNSYKFQNTSDDVELASVSYSSIKQENGTSFTNEAAWRTFYTTFTGTTSTGGGGGSQSLAQVLALSDRPRKELRVSDILTDGGNYDFVAGDEQKLIVLLVDNANDDEITMNVPAGSKEDAEYKILFTKGNNAFTNNKITYLNDGTGDFIYGRAIQNSDENSIAVIKVMNDISALSITYQSSNMDSADAGTFTGAFALSSTTPQYYDDYTQSGALTLSIGGSAVLGGIAKVKITANGSTIDGFASWKNLGGDTITNTNGAVNYIIVNKTKTEIHYTVKVL